MKHTNIAVVIPSYKYDEDEKLEDIVRELKREFVQIVIIDDSGNPERVLDFPGREVHIIKNKENAGYSMSIMEGIKWAYLKGFKYVLTMDADYEHFPEDAEKLIIAFKNTNFNDLIVIGNRYNEHNGWSKKRLKFQETFLSMLFYLIMNSEHPPTNKQKRYGYTDTKFMDPLCGYRLFSVETLLHLNLSPTGFGLPLDMFLSAFLNGISIKFVNINTTISKEKNNVSTIKFNEIMDNFNILRKYFYGLKLQSYNNLKTLDTGSPYLQFNFPNETHQLDKYIYHPPPTSKKSGL